MARRGSLRELVEAQLSDGGALDDQLDVIAIGKAAWSMLSACRDIVGERIVRALVVVDELGANDGTASEVIVGEHPLPGPGSLRAGERLLAFLAESTVATSTVFLSLEAPRVSAPSRGHRLMSTTCERSSTRPWRQVSTSPVSTSCGRLRRKSRAGQCWDTCARSDRSP